MRTSILTFVVVSMITPMVQSDDSISFNRDVRPILANNCFQCHGFDQATREAELRIDTREGATAELDSGEGHAIVPGKPDESVMLARILSSVAGERMPPADSGKTLTPKQINILRQWINEGAKYERHWSFVAPQPDPLPTVKQTDWPRNLIDYFVLARIEKEGLSPSPEADRRTLIRRVSQDVTGLPPTLEEIRLFLADNSSHAYEAMVDRYLSSERYGEHMARQWLDLARYADTSGYQYDRERTMWVWRDWVIHAYNNNMPFDQFTVEQLAGDLLPDPQPQQILATGFNRNHPITIEGGVIDEEYRTEYVIDRLTTTATVWMGLTVGCARCHEHKFDPISQKDFYQMSAFFNQVPERGLNGFDPKQQIASPLAKPQTSETLARIDELKKRLSALNREPDNRQLERWAGDLALAPANSWKVLEPLKLESSGGSKLIIQPDFSFVAGGANPRKDIYEVTAQTEMTNINAVRLECLTDKTLPGSGPGRHSNSNFVLSEFELVAVSIRNPAEKIPVKFKTAKADYSQANYHVGNAIDGTVANNNGWAVDGPTRKQPATAMFFASEPFGFEGGTKLMFRLRHEATFATHGIGRPRLAISRDDPASLTFDVVPLEVRGIAAKKTADRTAEEKTKLKSAYQKERASKAKSIAANLAELSKTRDFPPTMVMRDLETPRQTHVLMLGQYDRKGDIVAPGVPQALIPMPKDAPNNRLGFAQWLVHPKHPLTARVAVNRYWQQLFGIGIVKTSEDFGAQGEWPSHPGLLDTLSTKFANDGWNVKAILRLMLTSATYRQSPRVTDALQERDPENRLLARGPRFRLDAEQIRDQALAVSGLLVDKVGGPSVYPYQPKGLWMELNNRPGFSREYIPGKNESLYRRSMYTFWKRTVLSPMLRTFDAPGREFCTVRRSRTNTPLQALLLLQGPQFVESARQLAARMMIEGGRETESRITFGFELVTARLPSEKEIEILRRLYEERLNAFRQAPVAALKMLSVGDSPRDAQLDAAELAAWMEIARLLLNLDESVTKG